MASTSSHNTTNSRLAIPLQSIFVLSFVLQIFVAVGITGWLAFRNGRQAVNELAAQLLSATSVHIEEHLRTHTTKPPLITQINANAMRRGELSVSDVSSWQNFLWEQHQLFTGLNYIYFGSEEGKYVELRKLKNGNFEYAFKSGTNDKLIVHHYELDNQGKTKRKTGATKYDPRKRPWYQGVAIAKQPLWTQIYYFNDVPPTVGISFAHPYYDESGQLVGVFGADFTLSGINDFLTSLEVGHSGKVMIFERSGALVATSDAQLAIKKTNQRLQVQELKNPLLKASAEHLIENFNDWQQIQQPLQLEFLLNRERVLMQVTPFGDEFGLDWLVVVVVPESDFMGQINANTLKTIVLCLTALTCAIIVGIVAARYISEPVLGLSRASKAISNGNLEQKVYPINSYPWFPGVRELEVLSRSFNHMREQLWQSRQQLENYSQSLEVEVTSRTQQLQQEIRERQLLEEKLITSESEIRGFFEAMTDVVLLVNRWGANIKIAPTQAAQFNPWEVNLTIDKFFALETKDTFLAQVNRALETEDLIHFEYSLEIEHKQVWFAARISPVAEDSVAWVARNITKRKHMEAKLKVQAKRDALLSRISRLFLDQNLETAIEATLPELGKFMDCDRTCIFRYDSKARDFSLIHEWCAAGIEACINCRQKISPQSYPWLHSQLLAAKPLLVEDIDTLTSQAELEKREWQRQGNKSLVTIPILRAGKLLGYLGLDAVKSHKKWNQKEINFLQLVAEIIAVGKTRHQAGMELLKAKEAADKANRVKSEFLANMSHELRTPLNAILGFAQVLRRDKTFTELQKSHLEIINNSGEHLLNLINDVLDMSKIEAGKIALSSNNFDLYRLLNNLKQMWQIKAESKGLQLNFICGADVPRYINSDESKLRQILLNFLSNAIKFTSQGSVSLSVRKHQQLSPSVVTLYFEVKDTGLGIAQEEIASIFEPFIQTESGRQSQSGTGLGLPISRKFIQIMGGELKVESKVNLGSKFAFFLPVQLRGKKTIAASENNRHVTGLAAHQPQYRILIVEDRWESRQLLIQMLQPLKLELREACNGKQALEIWSTWQPHLIWMDMRMPVMNGYEATKQIKAHLRGQATVIIALTASVLAEEQIVILSAGCDDFVRKPFQEQVIFDKMAQHLGLRYLYEQEATLEDKNLEMAAKSIELEANSLRIMPDSWIAQLHDASTLADTELTLELIQQIPQTHGSLREEIKNLVHNFRWDKIMHLTSKEDTSN